MPKEIDGKDSERWRGDGNSCLSRKDQKSATECFENAIKIGIKDKRILTMTLMNMGTSYLQLENYQKASESYKKVIKIDSKFVHAWYGLGFANYHLKNYKEAINCFEKSLKVDPKNPNVMVNWSAALRNMGNSYKELQNYEKAIESYENALEIEPNDEQAKESLKTLKM